MVVSAAVGNLYLSIPITSTLIKLNGMNQLCQTLQKSKRVRTEECSLDVIILKRTCQTTAVKYGVEKGDAHGQRMGWEFGWKCQK